TKYFGNFAMFSTVNSNNLQDHFVSIVIPSSAKNKVYFDNTLLSPSEFKDFPYNGNFSYTSLFITDGRHVVQCSDGFLADCYGIGSAESYFYIAGFNLPDFDLNIKDSVVNYDCKAGNIDVRFSALSDKLLEKYTWYFGDGTTDTGRIIDHTYPAPGTYKVKLIGQAFNGKLDSSSINVLVDWPTFNPVWDKIIC